MELVGMVAKALARLVVAVASPSSNFRIEKDKEKHTSTLFLFLCFQCFILVCV